MADQANSEIAALRTEIEQLRDEVAQIAEILREIARNDVAGEGPQMYASVEKAWSEVKHQAGNLGREIEEKPVASAITGFGAGILMGLLLSRRRG